jgi:proline iminopeptidase
MIKTGLYHYQLMHRAEEFLLIEPFHEGYLSVSKEHRLWYAEYGNKDGIPVIFVHGGPGGGSGPKDLQFLDPSFYRIILCDQRGAGRSEPNAEIKRNTTSHLVEDFESLRKHLGIERWVLFGGSWGSALALIYGETHPDRVLGFILRGIFLGTKAEFLKLWYGMGDIYPEAFAKYYRFIPEEERVDIIAAYYRRLLDADPKVHMPAARSFCEYDFTCATLFDKTKLLTQLADDRRVLALARLFAHYSINNFFLTENQIIKNLSKIILLPLIIVHGRYDVICRASNAFKLYEHWPKSKLIIVQDGGHSNQEPSMIKALVEAGETMQSELLPIYEESRRYCSFLAG